MFKKGSGILLHVSSLPSKYGIGDFGPSAYKFADFLNKSKQAYWQILPLNPTERVYGDSPYSSISAFALNPILISPEYLVKYGYLTERECKEYLSDFSDQVDFPFVYENKRKMLDAAYEAFLKKKTNRYEFDSFCADNDSWLSNFALFVVLKNHFKGKQWSEWPVEFKKRDKKVLNDFSAEYSSNIEKQKFTQFIIYKQWSSLREYANKKGVKIIGDIPIYVNYDSVDAWSNPQTFKFDDDFQPVVVAGVPPDYFSETGQRWGNPVYNWDFLKKEGYGWWIQRIKYNLKLFDAVRIDHFRGFVACWEIPRHEDTAIKGKWVNAPADEFFNVLRNTIPDLPIIAEDLGIITPDVVKIMHKYNLPGMKVLLFAFCGDLSTHPYIPENYNCSCVVYTGTHDNNTIHGWWEKDATELEKRNLSDYLKKGIDVKTIHMDLINLASRSRAEVCIFPMQDVLGLGAEARMNTPATTTGNWQWRVSADGLTQKIADKLAGVTKASGRAA